ncbi:MAG: fibrobacter succinogenes major paralogous domain-containing protein [Bacteroidales bacterium]|nr:fibrobacter succinogenes major paralogous domain-containing protein [Bacteroidales bacterium]
MAANIDVGTMINDPNEQNNDSVVEKYCYNNTPANCTTYGGLYQWAEAIQVSYTYNTNSLGAQSWMTCDPCGSGGRQGLCPSGYHVPTDLEWSRYEWCVENNISPAGGTSLSDFQNLSGWRGSTSNTAGPGSKLKASSSNSPSWDGTNASGFTALPAGYRYFGGGFGHYLEACAYFWFATEVSATSAWYRVLVTGNWQSYRSNANKAIGFSLRCLQN